jgi:cytochrome P450
MVMRETTRSTEWESGMMPARTSIMIYAPFFHRDDRRLAFADRFAPDVWLAGESASDWPLIPFSRGPVVCPGQNLVLLIASTAMATLLDGRQLQLDPPTRLSPSHPLPGTLNHFSLRFTLAD